MSELDPVMPPQVAALSRSRGWIGLLLAVGVLAAIWLVVLPGWAERPAMHGRLRWLEERRINPGAMYYTELEAMPPILERMYEREARGKRDEVRVE